MPNPIQETYKILKTSFTSKFQPPKPESINEFFNQLYNLSGLDNKAINYFIPQIQKINSIKTGSLQNKLDRFIAASHFLYLYSNFCRKNLFFSMKNKTFHKTVADLVKTQYNYFKDALLKANLNQPNNEDIRKNFIEYLKEVENSTISNFDSKVAIVTGFDFDKTREEAQLLRNQLEDLGNGLSQKASTSNEDSTILSSASSIPKKEQQFEKSLENFKSKPKTEFILPKSNILAKEQQKINTSNLKSNSAAQMHWQKFKPNPVSQTVPQMHWQKFKPNPVSQTVPQMHWQKFKPNPVSQTVPQMHWQKYKA